MQKLISYPISVIYYLCFSYFGNFFIQYSGLFQCFWLSSTQDKCRLFEFFLVEVHQSFRKLINLKIESIPENVPLIFVEPSVCMILLLWFGCRSHCKFVSKKELGKVFQVFRIICVTVQFLLIEKIPNKPYQLLRISWIYRETQSFSCYFSRRNTK
jgi:hypothetical protein